MATNVNDSKVRDLEKCLTAGDLTGAEVIIKAVMAEKPTPADEADALISMAETYMDISTRLNEQYRDALQTVVKNLEKLNKAEAAVTDKARLSEVRGSLKI